MTVPTLKKARVKSWWKNQSIILKFSVWVGVLLCLMTAVGATGYVALEYLLRAHEAAGLSNTIQRLVFEMDREMEKARQLHTEFFRQYPKIGLQQAHERYAQPSVQKAARAVSISRTLTDSITKTQVSQALQAGNIDLNLYLSSAKRFAATSIESVELVTELAAPRTGLEAVLARERDRLKILLSGNSRLMSIFYDMAHFIDLYMVVRERHVMQSAFNMGFRLNKAIRQARALVSDREQQVDRHLNRLVETGEKILAVDAAISAKFRDFELQRAAADKVSGYLIQLAKQEVTSSEIHIKEAHEVAVILLVVAAAAGVAGALCIALVLNQTIARRILHLTSITQKFQQGQFDVAAQEDTMDELGRLAMAFNFMAERLRALIENLEEEVRARTSELRQANARLTLEIKERKQAESHLLQAQKMEAIGTLAGGIAHDFNNILAAIIGYAELAILDLEPSSKTAEYVNAVLGASIRAKELVAQILSFSRKQGDGPVQVQMGPIVKEIIKLMRATIPSSVEVREDIIDGDGFVMAGPTQVHQVVMNLSTNAAQAMEPAGGVLTVRLAAETLSRDLPPALPSGTKVKAGSYLKLTISDTGPGIGPGIMDKIFDPYFTTKETGKGTGMGLSVVHGIVTACGGGIRVESEPGKGTCFHVYLPRAPENGHRDARDVLPIEKPVRGTEHILVVDDEKTIVDITEKRLNHMGYRVTTATRSHQALVLFQSCPRDFDLVITDQGMPEMSGVSLARRLIAVRPDIPIVLCTGNIGPMEAGDARQAGICHVLMKPVQQQVFAETIRELLDRSKRL